jgi:hypothetical protein
METIDREQMKPPSRVFRRLDLMRLEVAKVGRKELFAWPGGKFEEKPISDFVAGGLIGDGAFTLFADDVFINHAASMKYRGPESLEGRPAVRVDYVVGPLQSGFSVHTAGGIADVDYSGSFWVDAESLDLIRLDVHAGDIPAQLGLSAVNVSIDYGAMRAGERHVALAQASVIEMVKTSGEVSRNEIGFTQCRAFVGDAKMVFGDDPAAPSTEPAAPVPTLVLPGGLTISLRLVKAIEAQSAGVGDAVTATVTNEVRDKQRVWLPKGATVEGRIRRLERRDETTPYVLVGLEFSDVEAGSDRFQFTAQMQSVRTTVGLAMNHQDRQVTRQMDLPSGFSSAGTVETRIRERFDQDLPGVGYLYLSASPFVVPKGLETIWKTETPGGSPAAGQKP